MYKMEEIIQGMGRGVEKEKGLQDNLEYQVLLQNLLGFERNNY